MKMDFASCFVIAILLSPVTVTQAADTGAAQTWPLSPTKAPAIAAKIKDRLAEETTFDLAQIKVAADQKGSVVLSGKVETRAAEEKAVSIVRGMEGVKVVTSSIQITNKE